jgi:Flagellar biogenesis protein
MGGEVWGSFFKIIIFLPMVLLLAYISLRIGGGKMMGMGSRIIKIVEKVPLSGKSSLYVALINDKPYVISSCEGKIEILMELPQDALEKLKQGEGSFKESIITNFNQLLSRKDRP